MHFSLFAHMIRQDGGAPMPTLHEQFVKLCRLADDGGMRAVWTGEHHCMNFTIAPNPFTLLVDIAGRTKNLRLGTATIVAPFWHPLKLAGEIAMTDVLTGGRLEVGIARGAYSYEYERLRPGMDAMRAGLEMREMLPLLPKLWAGDIAADGDTWRFPAATSAPPPLQKPHPPVWIAARDPSSHEFAVANGWNVQVTPLWRGDEEIESLMQKFNDAVAKCRPKGKAQKPKIMLLLHTYIAKDEADAESAAHYLARFYRHFGAWFVNKSEVRGGFIAEPPADGGGEMFSAAAMRKNLLIATPEEAINRLRHYQKLGFDEYSIWADNMMPFADNAASVERFIGQVMPAFQ
ncbi:MAG: LLM class flavin-dependent oxidoreductase [Gammaproteobacteria bacterium]